VPPLINTPCLAAFPIAETIATGVEMTKAHGQATTNKASPLYVHSPHDPKPNNGGTRSEEHTSELQSRFDLVCRLLLEKKNPYDRRKIKRNIPQSVRRNGLGSLVARVE